MGVPTLHVSARSSGLDSAMYYHVTKTRIGHKIRISCSMCENGPLNGTKNAGKEQTNTLALRSWRSQQALFLVQLRRKKWWDRHPPVQVLVLLHDYGEMVVGSGKLAKQRDGLGSSARIDGGFCVICLDCTDKIGLNLSGSLEYCFDVGRTDKQTIGVKLNV